MSDLVASPEDIAKAGMDARARGDDIAVCPYPNGSGERQQWLEGWHKPDSMDVPVELGFA